MFRNLTMSVNPRYGHWGYGHPSLKIYPNVISAFGHSCFLHDLMLQLLKVSYHSRLVVISFEFEPFLWQQPQPRRPNCVKLISCVCQAEVWGCPGAVSCYGCRCMAEMTCWWPGGEEALRRFLQLKTEVLQRQGGELACFTYLSVENNQRWGNGRKIKFLWRDVSSKF